MVTNLPNVTFIEDLLNRSSTAYKNLSDTVTKAAEKRLSGSQSEVVNVTFYRGSVIAM